MRSLAGVGFVILNAIRVLNIITFLVIISASIVFLATISLTDAFCFFKAVSHVVVVLVASKSILLYAYNMANILSYSIPHRFRSAHLPPIFRSKLASPW